MSKSGLDRFNIQVVKDPNGIKGSFFLEVKRPNHNEGMDHQIIADFFSYDELVKLRRVLSKYTL